LLALDSNILLRYVTQDDPVQRELATELIETGLSAENPGFVSLVALLETVWALRRGYGATPEVIADVVRRLVHAPPINLAEQPAIEAALALDSRDLADAILHELGRAAGCSETLTFDRRFARLKGVRLLSA
jgi:predicted nucleic-acid-binding protein